MGSGRSAGRLTRDGHADGVHFTIHMRMPRAPPNFDKLRIRPTRRWSPMCYMNDESARVEPSFSTVVNSYAACGRHAATELGGTGLGREYNQTKHQTKINQGAPGCREPPAGPQQEKQPSTSQFTSQEL